MVQEARSQKKQINVFSKSKMSTFTYVLYYVRSGSQGCDNAIKIIDKNIQLKSMIHIQDVKSIEKPSWLKGVPVLAKVSTKEIWEGSSAIEQLNYLSGYYSGVSTVLSSLGNAAAAELSNNKQPWDKYTSNLAIHSTFASPVTVHYDSSQPAVVQQPSQSQSQPAAPSQSQPADVLLSTPPPSQSQSQLAVVQQPSQSQSQPAVVLSSPSPSPPQSQPIDFPTNDRLITKMQNENTSGDKSKAKDPNRLQPMPLPDNPQKSSELILPPLPVFPKKEVAAPPPPPPMKPPTPENNSNRILSNDNKIDNRRPDSNDDGTLSEELHDDDDDDDDVDIQNKPFETVTSNKSITSMKSTKSMKSMKFNEPNGDADEPTKLVQPTQMSSDHNEMVFSQSELEEIENVMTKPKTINKRPSRRGRGQPQQQQQSSRKNSNTIVIKGEYVNHSAEDE